jgi:type I restriction enzyme S subunit
MPYEWQIVTIADLGRVVTGKTPSTAKQNLWGRGYPFITPTDIGNERYCETSRQLSQEGHASQSKLLLPEKSICVTCIASVGKMCVTHQPSFTNQQINSIIVDESRFDPFFVFYLLQNEVDRLKAIAGGVATPIINKTAFSKIEVRVPALTVQKRIAGILSAYDELIENSQRRIRVLEAMARNLYREWFVHFRYPGHENIPLFPSPLGEIPKGWEVKKLADLAEIKGGKQLEKDDIHESADFPVFGGNGIQGYSEKATHEGFVIAFGRVGAYCGSIHWSYSGAWLNNNSSSVVPFNHDELVLHHLLDFNFTNLRGGAAQPFISNTALAGIGLLFPGDVLAEQFCELVKPIGLQQVTLERQIKNLRKTRDLLLPRLLSGQIPLNTPSAEAA